MMVSPFLKFTRQPLASRKPVRDIDSGEGRQRFRLGRNPPDSDLSAPSAGGTPVVGAKPPPRNPVVSELTAFAADGCKRGCGSGSTVGPDKALYVTDGKAGRVLRIDPYTGDPPQTDFFVASGVQYSMQPYRGGFLVADGHRNRMLWVS